MTQPNEKIDLQIDINAANVDDMFFILEVQAGERDGGDPKEQLAMLKLLDRLVVGGLRSRGIPLKSLPDVLAAVGEKLKSEQEVKN
jgi:hypothetical protein